MRKNPRTERFDPLTIPDLLEKAKAGDMVARNRLLYMFQSLVAALVNVCLNGKPFTPHQKTFVRLFATKDESIQSAGMRLKLKLSHPDKKHLKDKLFLLGQVAVLEAINKCEKNLASTILYCFKEEITTATKEATPTIHTDYDTLQQSTTIHEDTYLNIFLTTLSEEDQVVVEKILNGEKGVKISRNLKSKLSAFLRPDTSI